MKAKTFQSRTAAQQAYCRKLALKSKPEFPKPEFLQEPPLFSAWFLKGWTLSVLTFGTPSCVLFTIIFALLELTIPFVGFGIGAMLCTLPYAIEVYALER